VETMVRAAGARGRNLRADLARATDGAADRWIGEALDRAKATASDASASASRRVRAIGTLEIMPLADASEILEPLLGPREPREVQIATLRTLGSYDDARVADVVLAAWSGMGPAVREEGIETLMSRPK